VIETVDDNWCESAIAWMMIFLAQCYAGLNDANAAIQQLVGAVEQCDEIAYAKFLIGQIHEQLGYLDLAEHWYREALATPEPKGALWMDVPGFRGKLTQDALDGLLAKKQEVTCGKD